MITKLAQSTASVLAFEVTGKVSLEAERQWIEEIESAITNQGSVSVMVVLGEQASWGMQAGIEDLKWVMTHMDKLNRIAIVSSSSVWKWLVALDSPFARLVGIKEKHFELTDRTQAWEWISNQ